MFQYEFFSLKGFIPHRRPKSGPPACFAQLQDIAWIRSSYWAEHCLECGEPECYETCPHFRARGDQRCRLFRYGIYDNPHFPDSPYHAEVSFRKWGKMETIVSPGSMSPERAMEVHNEWKERSQEKCRLMHLGSYGLKKFPIEERRKFDSAKYVFAARENRDNPQDTFHFLLQLYSHERKPFTLFFDVTDDTDLAFRRGITVYPGYNQHCFDVAALFPPKGRLRAKFYPADNAEVSVVFLFCEFIQLKPGVSPATYPETAAERAADKIKCVAWDLDNTLWDGILIESDPSQLCLRPGVAETIRALDERGILQIVVSKNKEEDVLPVLKRLGIDDFFVCILASWDAKSTNLEKAAGLLNIGINSFALIDDSAFERSEVRDALPMVRTYEETILEANKLLSLPELDVPVTADSVKRRRMYQTEAKRRQAAETSGEGNLDFLRRCQLQAILSRPETEDEILRSCELLQRTNQLNLSGRRYSPDAFRRHLKETDRECLICKCADRFGSYGQVAYLEAQPKGDTLYITEYAMSCRVAAKCLESALSKALLEHYSASGICRIELTGSRTDRNGLLIDSFTAAGYDNLGTAEQIRLICKGVDSINNPSIVSVINKL